MNRNSILSFIIVAAGTGALLATSAKTQFGAPKAYVNLQPTTPGTGQSGHANVSGTIRASQFVGGGAGVSGVNADLLDGIDSTALAQVAGTNLWSGANTFSNAGNSFIGNGSGLTSVNADLLDGINSTAFLTGIPNPLTLSGTNISHIISAENNSSSGGSTAIQGVSLAATGTNYGGVFESSSTGGTGVYGYATDGTGNTFGVVGRSESTLGTGVWGNAPAATGSTFGVIGTSGSTSGTGVYGIATASTGNASGGHFRSMSSTGYGVYGEATATFGYTRGVYGSTNSTNGRGVYGIATAGTGQTVGVYGQSDSISGHAVQGLSSATTGFGTGGYFSSASTNGKAVYGLAITVASSGVGVWGETEGNSGAKGVYGRSNATTGNNWGGSFQCVSTSGTGVYGLASAASGITYGGHFVSDSPSGYGVFGSCIDNIGVFGEATGTVGVNYGGRFESNGVSGRGIYALANATGAGDTPYGVRGYCSTATLGLAVFATGDMGASGVKSFRIDHPEDPENKYLLHYSSESPFPQNFYSGNTVTDGKGYAWVELPAYFADINTNFKYQLTILDDGDSELFVQVKVSKKIRGNSFQIRTTSPNVEVSWRVEADRNDLRIQYNRPTDVREKSGLERGKYQHPEYYGQPASMGMDYTPNANSQKVIQALRARK